MRVTQTKSAKKLEQERILWLRAHRGAIAEVAREMGRGHQSVLDVYWSRRSSRGLAVERRLAELGAPGFERFLEAPADGMPPAA